VIEAYKSMIEVEKLGCAFHESSHAAVATLLEASITSVQISRKFGTWIGSTPVAWSEPPGRARKQKIFQIAIAAPLGQIKYRAGLAWHDSIFDRDRPLTGFLGPIRKGSFDGLPSLSVDFIKVDGTRCNFRITDFNDVGDFEEVRTVVAHFTDSELLFLMGLVQDGLNSTVVWAAISELAEDLYRDHFVSGEKAMAVIRKHAPPHPFTT
jgi:hypothetical protein